MNKHKVGLVLGTFFAVLHFCWVILVAVGLAQPLMNFIYSMHSLSNPPTVLPFNLIHSIVLIILTFIVGYVFGYDFAITWNKFHKS